MEILVADRFPETHLARLRELGHDVDHRPDLQVDDLAAAVAGRQVLVVRSTRVPRAVLEAADALRLVVRAGSGTDTIDADAAAEHGIAVCNVPGRNALAVAELAFGLLLALDRRLPDQVADLRGGRWRKKEYQRAEGVAGRRVGVVGVGDIGLAFAQRAAAFACHVHVVAKADRAPEVRDRLEELGATEVADLEALAAACDVLSFHLPLTAATRGVIGRPLLDHVRPGAILINTARGELVDEDALLAAIEAKGLRVGLDVFPDEPAAGSAEYRSRLASHPSVYGTHHVGASTAQAQEAIADEVVAMLDAFTHGELRHCVNGVELAGVAR